MWHYSFWALSYTPASTKAIPKQGVPTAATSEPHRSLENNNPSANDQLPNAGSSNLLNNLLVVSSPSSSSDMILASNGSEKDKAIGY